MTIGGTLHVPVKQAVVRSRDWSAGSPGARGSLSRQVTNPDCSIGLRRALGATRGQIRIQFLAESILLSLAGALAGLLPAIRAARLFPTQALLTI
jgi:hypothetical protein